jgi:hypothetical protein
MRMNRQDTSALIDGFLSRGGSIKKLPEALPTTAGEVVQYLKSQKVDVGFESDKIADGKFICDGDVIDLQGLVQIANRLRRRQRRPVFDLSLRG